MTDRYRRRTGLIYRRGTIGGHPKWILDGGQDAPLGPKDRALFKVICAAS